MWKVFPIDLEQYFSFFGGDPQPHWAPLAEGHSGSTVTPSRRRVYHEVLTTSVATENCLSSAGGLALLQLRRTERLGR